MVATDNLVQIRSRHKTLADLKPGDEAFIGRISGSDNERLRLIELGCVEGTAIRVVRTAPLGDPVEVELRGFRLSLQRREAAAIGVNDGQPVLFDRVETESLTPPTHPSPKSALVLGNPNCGKSTLFSALSGSHVSIANYPGVTVDRAVGRVGDLDLIDLPGCYSLETEGRSLEEQIAGREANAAATAHKSLLVVLDATALERGLYLALQAMDLGVPMVCAVNMADEAERAGLVIDYAALSEFLGGVPCIPTVATKKRGLRELLAALANAQPPRQRLVYKRDNIESRAVARYFHINTQLHLFLTRPKVSRVRWSDRVDALLTHPLSGTLIFLALLALIFSALFSLSQPLMDGISGGFDWLAAKLAAHLPHHWLSQLLCEGFIAGVGTTLAFLPQILLLLFFMTTLEAVGYLSRAAFLVDRVMRLFGLSGKAFVPMLSGYACAVPAILSLRTLERQRDRLLTMLVIPLMSCSARLPVYTLILATLFPATLRWFGLPVNSWLLLALYLVSTGFAFAALGILSRTVPEQGAGSLVLELPPYRMPSARVVLRTVARRANDFLQTAGTLIVVISGLMWLLLHFPNPAPANAPQAEKTAALERSYAGQIGHFIEPAIRPLGFDWKIGVGLVGSFAAREVFVATMGVIHGADTENGTGSLMQAMRTDRQADGTPVYTPRTALSLLLFFMLACQCTSTLAVMYRETRSVRWPAFAFAYMLVLAYGVSWLAYRLTPFLDRL